MRYPQTLARFNKIMGVISGALILIIGLLSVIEIILRGIFSRPTFWSLDVSQYTLIWAIFLGSAYSFQEKGHVAVDFIREALGKRFSVTMWRTLTIIGYFLSVVVIAVFLWNGIEMSRQAIELRRLTIANVQIPIIYLYSAMVVGSVIMLATVCCIILDVLGKGEKYL